LDCTKLFANETETEVVSLELDVNNRSKNSNENRLALTINYDYGRVVGAASIKDLNGEHILLVLKEYGTIQIWNVDSGRIMNRAHLDKKVVIFLGFSYELYRKFLLSIQLKSHLAWLLIHICLWLLLEQIRDV